MWSSETVVLPICLEMSGRTWAMEPYLHNGSVPNLWELLKRLEDRVREFWAGSHEIDTENVGFVIAKGKN